MDVPGENDGVIVALAVYHNGIIESVHEPIKCSYNERTHRYTGRGRVIGRIAGQMISVIYALLKKDQEVLSKLSPGVKPPAPVLYDQEIHRQHRTGHYSTPAAVKPKKLFQLPSR